MYAPSDDARIVISLTEEELRQEQVRLLYKHMPLAILLNLTIAVVLVSLVAGRAFDTHLLYWLMAMASLMLMRGADLLSFRQTGLAHATPRNEEALNSSALAWLIRYVIGAVATAVAWDLFITGFVITLDVFSQSTVTLVYALMTSASVMNIAALRWLSFAQLFLMLALPATLLMQPDHPTAQIIGGLGLIWAVLLAPVIANSHRNIIRALLLFRQNSDLVQRAEQRQIETMSLNEELSVARSHLMEANISLEDKVRERTIELEREIAERISYQRELERMANEDPLTGLANRTCFVANVDKAIHSYNPSRASANPLLNTGPTLHVATASAPSVPEGLHPVPHPMALQVTPPTTARAVDDLPRPANNAAPDQSSFAQRLALLASQSETIELRSEPGPLADIKVTAFDCTTTPPVETIPVGTINEPDESHPTLQTFTADSSDVEEVYVPQPEAESVAELSATDTSLDPEETLLPQNIDTAQTQSPERFAIYFIDLDRFKEINDGLGHSAGDLVLRTVAQRIRHACGEAVIAGRWGGDEFVLLHRHLESEADLIAMGERLLSAIAEPIDALRATVSVGASIGVSIFPQHGECADDLIEHADIAVYQAKRMGRAMARVYQPEWGQEARRRLELVLSLRKAIEQDKLNLHFQPIVDTLKGSIFGFEALCRWESSEHGPIPPGVFVPIAEESGLMPQLGRWVLRKACEITQRYWPNPCGPLIAVNVSVVQLLEDGFMEEVREILHRTGLPPQRLELELTESLFAEKTEHVQIVLKELRNMGISVSIDDFGTGYSSMSYLRKFPVDLLKIDRSFVKDDSIDGQSILSSIVQLARSLDLEIIVEGVETQQELQRIMGLGAHNVQGYYFAKPMPPELACQWVVPPINSNSRIANAAA